MPGPEFREAYYVGKQFPSVVKSVNGVYTSTTLGDIWVVDGTKKIQILGWRLSCFVATVLAGDETAGDYVVMCDAAVTTPIAVLGILPTVDTAAGAIFGTSAVGNTTFTTAATAWTSGQALPIDQIARFPEGYYTAAALGNDIKFALVGSNDGAAEDVSTGQIRVVGTIWGHELNS